MVDVIENKMQNPTTPGLRAALRLWCRVWLLLAVLSLAASSRAQTPVISEFMAANTRSLVDEDGEYSDWIEVYNPGTNSVSLFNWCLTDSAGNLNQWRFPATNIGPSSYLVVFASAKNRRIPGRPLHTNFKLDAVGEYLALLKPDGVTIASEFAPAFPPQAPDVSYGNFLTAGTNLVITTGSKGRFQVPRDGSLGESWTSIEFDDSGWPMATNGLGFDSGEVEIARAASAVLESQPAAYWRLTEASGLSVANLGWLGGSLTGALTGGVQLAQPGPRPATCAGFESNNFCAGFDGVDDRIEVPYHAALNNPAFTVECWAQASGGDGTLRAVVCSRATSPSRGYSLYASSSNRWEFWVGNGSAWISLKGSAMTNGQWTHLVATYDGSKASLYCNGQISGSTNTAFSANPNRLLRIGAGATESSAGANFFMGRIDETAVYDRPLTSVEVQQHYLAASGAAPAPTNGPNAIAALNPLAWWRLNEASGTVMNNLGTAGAGGGYYTNGALLGMAGLRPPSFPSFETTNTSVTFDGSNDRALVPYNSVLNSNLPFTVAAWIKPALVLSNNNYVSPLGSSYRSGSIRNGWLFYQSHSGGLQKWQFNVGGQSGYAATLTAGTATVGKWSFLAGVYDGVNALLYQDGVLVGSAALTTAYSPNAVWPFSLGGLGDGSRLFNGTLDEVFLVPRALSGAELAQLYASATNVAPAVQPEVTYSNWIATDVRTAMLGLNASAYLRLPFIINNVAELAGLRLRVRCDDGFVAWLNGQEVARANAPTSPDWQSAATALRVKALAVAGQEFDLTSDRGWLVPGTNVLAIQGLNLAATNSDFLLDCDLMTIRDGAGLMVARYFTVPTPGAANGTGSTDLGPILTEVASVPALPAQPASGDPITVTARIASSLAPMAGATLYWRVMFNPLNSTPMLDDGLHGDGAAGDGIYGAMIPGGSASMGQMVRWYVTATDTEDHVSRWPTFITATDSEQYLGTVIANPTVISAMPVLHQFIENLTAADTRAGTRCSLFYNGEFYDNVLISLHGQSSASWAKKPYNLDFNKDHRFGYQSGAGRVKDAKLMSNWGDKSRTHNPLAHEFLARAGSVSHWAFQVRVQRNSQFFSIADLMEDSDDRWMERVGRDPDGALYKIYNNLSSTSSAEKKTRLYEGNTDLNNLITSLSETLPMASRVLYAYDNLDLPQTISYFAGLALVSSQDHGHKNYYAYRDSNISGEWTLFPWDTDLTWGRNWTDSSGYFTDALYVNNCLNFYPGSAVQAKGSNRLYNVIFDHPDFRRMYLRRLRTVMETLLQPPGTPSAQGIIDNRIRQMMDQMDPASVATSDADLDYAKWGSWGNMYQMRPEAQRIMDLHLLNRRAWLFNSLQATLNGEAIPATQPTNPAIAIAAIEYDPASHNQAEEYICLTNQEPTAIDLSGWKIEGAVVFSFRPGTVVPANGQIYVSPDVRAFRSRNAGPRGGMGLFVTGPYRGQLSARGETVILMDQTGRVVATNTYAGTPSLAQQFLRITELMYHPDPQPGSTNYSEEFEYVELRNISTNTTINLAGVRLTNGLVFSFTNSTLLGAQQTLVLARNSVAFRERYGATPTVSGPYPDYLDNDGARITLLDNVNEEILDFSYSDAWYPITDGLGFSLVTVSNLAPPDAWNDKVQWRASGVFRGSPGGTDSVPAYEPVRINEALTHTDLPQVDTIELHNPTPGAVNLGGWFLTDDFFTPRKCRIPPGTSIPANGYALFDEYLFNNQADTNLNFRISSMGDDLWLFAADGQTNLTGYYHGFTFGASANGVTFGRYLTSHGREDFVAQTVATLGTNNAGPRLGPVTIRGIMYHPPDVLTNGVWLDDAENEFVEFVNVATTNVPLFDLAHTTNRWRLSGAVDWVFPGGLQLTPGQRIIVAGFDPANTTSLAAFRAKWNLPVGLMVLGPWGGKLDNSADDIHLERPDHPNLDGSVPYILVDRVRYEHAWPWPANADGTGTGLYRLLPGAYGDEPWNWSAAIPPGDGAGDADGDGMPDWWETTHSLDRLTSDAALDPDGDGLTNYQEWLARLDPQDPGSVLRLEVTTSPGAAVLGLAAMAEVGYTIQHSSGVTPPVWTTWQQVSAAATNRWLTFTNAPSGGSRFYRVLTPQSP